MGTKNAVAGAARAAVTGQPPSAPHSSRSISGRGATAKEALRKPHYGNPVVTGTTLLDAFTATKIQSPTLFSNTCEV